ncbi:MAG: Fur family transcriptional regulator [bacterium]|nr:Fur family transcriptional regulator [bacterium]
MIHVQSAIVEERLRKFQEACRARGLKITPQRLEIFRELASSNEHPSVEEIFERIRHRMPTVSLDTVYRTLATLNDTGVVSRVEVLDDRSRFDANTEPHHHFVCVRCKRVVDFEWPLFDHLQIPEELRGVGVIHQPHAELRGVCNACLKT